VLNVVFRILAAIISVYGLLVLMRVLVKWIVPMVYGRPWDLLCRVVDPYLSVFHRIKSLKRRAFDLTVFLAIAVLWVLSSVLWSLSEGMPITIGLILAIIVSTLWGCTWVLFAFFIFFGILRLIPILFHGVGGYMIWKAVDTVIYPVVSRVTRLFRLGPRSGYTQHLLLTIGLLFAAWLLGELVFRQLVGLLQSLPF
jgi:uncharacterized protein YggT (Ycf19 family)